jgi:hypothetical protein
MTIEADETYIGGKPANRAHGSVPVTRAVASLMERGGREAVRVEATPKARAEKASDQRSGRPLPSIPNLDITPHRGNIYGSIPACMNTTMIRRFGQTQLGEGNMGGSSLSKSDEINRNLAKFLEMLPSLTRDHSGKWALMRNAEIIEFYDSAIDAQIAGNVKFDDHIFSIQPVKEEAEELGYFSYAVDPRTS